MTFSGTDIKILKAGIEKKEKQIMAKSNQIEELQLEIDAMNLVIENEKIKYGDDEEEED